MNRPRPMAVTIRERLRLALVRTAAPPVGNGHGITIVDLDDALTIAIADADEVAGGVFGQVLEGIDLDDALERMVEELREEGLRIEREEHAGYIAYHLVEVPAGVIDARRAA